MTPDSPKCLMLCYCMKMMMDSWNKRECYCVHFGALIPRELGLKPHAETLPSHCIDTTISNDDYGRRWAESNSESGIVFINELNNQC